MDVALLSALLETERLGRQIIHFKQIGSTNAVALEMAARGSPEGTLVAADFQSAGHGRHGRQWIADAGDCLLLSLVLRPRIAVSDTFYLTMLPALAIRATASSLGIRQIGLKWPNDVQIRGRKVAGILTELSLRGTKVDYAVVGIGLNVNMDVSSHSEIAEQATSLRAELGACLSVERVCVVLLREFERRYVALERGETAAIFADWRANLTTLGQEIEVHDSAGSFRALAEDVTADGGLVIRRDGERLVVYGGEVTLARPAEHDEGLAQSPADGVA